MPEPLPIATLDLAHQLDALAHRQEAIEQALYDLGDLLMTMVERLRRIEALIEARPRADHYGVGCRGLEAKP